MKNTFYQFTALITLLALVACGGGSSIEKKKKELDELKAKHNEISAQIKGLEAEIAQSGDTTNKRNEKSKMVAISEISLEKFERYVDVQGRVDGDENIVISAKVPSTVIKIYVKSGDQVKAGQAIAQLDGEIVASQVRDLETNLKFVTEVFNKQKSLWEKGVGSEIQFLQAKTNKESLEQKLATLKENLSMYTLKSPIGGTVDEVMIKVGQNIAPGMPASRIVNFNKLKVKADLAETYAAEVKSGNQVIVHFPDIHKDVHATLRYSGRAINLLNRTFGIEADLPSSQQFIPNMIAVVKVVAYKNEKAIVIPMNLIQDSEGKKVVYIADKANHKAVKREVVIGNTYNGKAEIVSGLNTGDFIIEAGYQDLNDQENIQF